jgi:hypothetical protein
MFTRLRFYFFALLSTASKAEQDEQAFQDALDAINEPGAIY